MRFLSLGKRAFFWMVASVLSPYLIAVFSFRMVDTFHFSSDGLVWPLRFIILCPLLAGPAIAAMLSSRDSTGSPKPGLIWETLLAIPIAPLACGFVIKAIWKDQGASYGLTFLYGEKIFLIVLAVYLVYPIVFYSFRKKFFMLTSEKGSRRRLPMLWVLINIAAFLIACLPLFVIEGRGRGELKHRQDLYADHVQFDQRVSVAERRNWPLQSLSQSIPYKGVRVDPFDFMGWPNMAIEDEKGRLLVAGKFSAFGMRRANGLVRILPTGALDLSFFPAPESPYQNNFEKMFACANGLLYLLRRTDSREHSQKEFELMKILSNGDPDPMFKTLWKNFSVNHMSRFRSVDVQPTGKVLVLYTSREKPNVSQVTRIDLENKLDTQFNRNIRHSIEKVLGFGAHVESMKALSSGKILLYTYPGTELEKNTLMGLGPMIVLDVDGNLVKRFFPQTHTDYFAGDTKLLRADKPLGLIRLDGNGEVLDNVVYPRGIDKFETVGFGFDGTVFYGTPGFSRWSLGAYNFRQDVAFACFSREGKFVDSFLANKSGNFILGQVGRIYIQQDGKIILLGGFSTEHEYRLSFKRYIIRLNQDGTMDPTFDPGALQIN